MSVPGLLARWARSVQLTSRARLGRLARLGLHRIVGLMREVGVLLIALAPLDGMLGAGENREAVMPMVTAFLELGAALFLCSVVAEWLAVEKDGLEGSK